MNSTYAIQRLPQDGGTHLRRKFAVIYNEALRAIYPGQDLILQAPNILASPEALHKATRHLHTWICVAPNAYSGATSLAEGQWVGMYSLDRPLETGQSSFFDTDTATTAGSLWVTRRMYVQEEHRSKETVLGLQQALEVHTRKYHDDMGSEAERAKLRMFALHCANAQNVRGFEYGKVLEEGGTMQRLPGVLVEAMSDQVMSEAWGALFEMHVDLQGHGGPEAGRM